LISSVYILTDIERAHKEGKIASLIAVEGWGNSHKKTKLFTFVFSISYLTPAYAHFLFFSQGVIPLEIAWQF